VLEVAGDERLSGLEHENDAPAVAHRQHVQAELLLQRRQRLRARTERNQRVLGRLVQKRVDLVRVQGLGDDIAGVCQRCLQVGDLDREQALERL